MQSLIILLLWDVLSAASSVLLAIRVSESEIFSDPNESKRIVFYVLFAVTVTLFCNILVNGYTISWRHVSLSTALAEFGAVAAGFFGVLMMVAVIHEPIRWETVLCWAVFELILLLAARFSFRTLLGIAKLLDIKKYTAAKKIIIYGAGLTGRFLLDSLADKTDKDSVVVCFLDDDRALAGMKVKGVRIFGGGGNLADAIRRYSAHQVIIAIPSAPKELIEKVMKTCHSLKCEVKMFGSINTVDFQSARVVDINVEDLLRREKVELNMEAVNRFVSGKTVLVTGGAGSIGSEICQQVLFLGCRQLIIFDIDENGLFDINNKLCSKWAGRYLTKLGSIRDINRLEELFSEYRPQVVFHAAAHKHVPMMELSPKESIKNNVFGTLNVARAAIRHHAEKFILISTDKAVNPTSIMGASKRLAEMVIQMLSGGTETELASVRFGNVLGSVGSVVPFFQQQILAGGPVTVTHRDMRRYFMTIPEAVQLVLEAGAMANGGETFVLDMGEPVKIYDLACEMIRLSGYDPEVDIPITIVGIRPGEKLFEEISFADENVNRTANKKIVVLKPTADVYTALSSQMREFRAVTETGTEEELFKFIRRLVPEFNHHADDRC
jgi:FlaA1/EpsC-like NDP-sugar epimerase